MSARDRDARSARSPQASLPHRLSALALLALGCGGNLAPHTTCTPPRCAPAASLWAAEVAPSTDPSAFPQQELASVDVSTGAITMSLDAPLTISGTVKMSGATTNNVSVVATRPSRIAGRPDVFYQTLVLPSPTNATMGSYALTVSRLVDGESYSLRVVSAAADVSPPQVFYVTPTDQDAVVADLTLDDINTLTRLSGVIVDGLDQPLAQMQVQAFDEATTRPASTVAMTDSHGAFNLKLSRGPVLSHVQLQAKPGPQAGAGIPTLSMRVDISKPDGSNSVVAMLRAPALPAPVQIIYPVIGTSQAGTQQKIAGARCVFSADLSDPASLVSATYQVTAVTDMDGKATVALVPGVSANRSYHVTVVPPAASEFASSTFASIPVGTSGGYAAPINLPTREHVVGRVLDPRRMPVRGALVTPLSSLPLATNDASALAMTDVPEATTDVDGKFLLLVDAGTYDVAIAPPPLSALSRFFLDGTTIEGDRSLADITLPVGTLVPTMVVGATGAPVGHADIRIYRVTPPRPCPTGLATCVAAPRLQTEAATNAGGNGSLLLPSQN